MNNPCDAPAADLSHGGPATYDPELLSVSGRCRYLAYSMALSFLLMVVYMTIAMFVGMSKPDSSVAGLVIAGAWVLTTVFVLGILAAVALPAYQSYLMRSVLSNAHTN